MMRRAYSSVLVLAIVVFAASAAPAPEAPPLIGVASGALSWLYGSQLREELKLSEDQLKKIEELKAKRRQEFAALRGRSLEERKGKRQDIIKATEVALAKILTRKQLQRVEQLYLQRRGPAILRMPQVAAALKITEEQKAKMTDIWRESFVEYRQSRAKGEQPSLGELFKRRDEKFLNVLTSAQKKKWQQLLGAPFKWETRAAEEPKQPGQGSDHPVLRK